MNFVELIESLTLGVFGAIVGFLLLMSVICVVVGLKAKKLAKAIAATPISKINSALPGYIKLEGQVRALRGKSLEAPLTRWPCLWYHAKVEQYARNVSSTDSTHRYSWQTIDETTSSEPFSCDDGTGICAIFPDGADVTPTDRSVWYGASAVPEDRNPAKHCAGESAEGMLRISGTPNHKFRYTEERIYANDSFFGLGQFENEPEEDEVSDVTSNQLRRSFSKNEPFVLSTTPSDKLLEANRLGARAAIGFAIFPVLLAAALIWIRFN